MHPIEHVKTLRGAGPGATVAIFCGVHGDERAGILAVDRIAESLHVAAGTVHLVRANPPAIAAGVRLVGANLNRLFTRELASAEPSLYEHRRANELMDLLDACDALLDLHSYASPHGADQAVPFAICEPPSAHVAALFDVPFVIHGFSETEKGGSDGYMHARGKIGVCVELGCNERAADFVGLGVESALRFLAHFGCVAPRDTSRTAQKILRLAAMHKKTHDDFRFVRDFRTFEPVSAGQQLAQVGGVAVAAAQDGVIIFPNAARPVGVEVFLLAASS